MKKIILFVLGAALAFSASAQDWQDALLFSENNYLGTARGVGMGNALTAVGGDPGSLVFNPAGSAVASYSQFVITPGFTLSFAGVQEAEGQPFPMMADHVNTSYGRLKLPNLGFILSMDTGRRHGLKRMSFGVVFNSTNNFTGRFNAAGSNPDNSFAAALATSADGYSESVLGTENWFYSGDPARMPAWSDMAGYRGGMFNAIPDHDARYMALTEVIDSDGRVSLAAPVYQGFGHQSYGGKHDAIVNFALNYSDRFYIGANLGITSLKYVSSEYFSERPDNPDEFPVIKYSDGTSARFESLRMKYNYRLAGNGVYLKVGFLWRPVAGLRLAGAVQTPTMLNLIERYGYNAEVSLSGKYVSPAGSPTDEWIYALRTPMRANAGFAYTFGNLGLLSADYEYVNYASAAFRSRTEDNEYADGSFSGINDDIAANLGSGHQVRLGLEVKATPDLAFRAGYNLILWKEVDQQMKHNASVGLGYSWGGMFVDAAVRARFVPAEYYIPYEYYYAPNPSQFYNKVVNEDYVTPEIEVNSVFVDALLTLGWRF